MIMLTLLDGATGMALFAQELQTNLTGANLWGEIAPLAGFLSSIILFAFGYYVFRKSAKGAGKGKVRL